MNILSLWEILIQKLPRRVWRLSLIPVNLLKIWLKMQHVIRIQKTHHASISFWQIILIVFKIQGWLRLAYLIFITWRLLLWKQHSKNYNQISYITRTIENFQAINSGKILFPVYQLKKLELTVMAWESFCKYVFGWTCTTKEYK